MKKLVLFMAAIAMVACKNNKDTAETETEQETETEVVEGKEVAEEREWEILFDGTNYDQWKGYNKGAKAIS